MLWPYVAALLAGVVLGAGATLALGLPGRRRIARIREAVRELAAGNLGHRVIMPGSDEVSALADELDAFADTLQADREAERAREASRRTLLANISHDLRTPVTSIAGYVDALRRGLGDDPERYLAIIDAKVGELADLTDDVFYEARLDSGDLALTLQDIDLAEAVRRSVLGFEPELRERGIDVTVEIPEEVCPVRADGMAVARILGNLMSNALRHGERMTRLSVSVTAAENGCAVRLTNDGASPPQDLERLFERGVAGSGGAGLGLAIARDLADRMGAMVTAERVGPTSIAFALEFREM